MDEENINFLKEVFKEMNEHLRTTERKSLMVTSAYIGLFSIFLASIAKTGYRVNSFSPSPWLQIAIQSFFLIIGSCIFLMQQWYRAWKEHYIEVCFKIRKKILDEGEFSELLPYWLRYSEPGSKISIDNLLKYLTAAINFVIVFIICYELLGAIKNQRLGILIIAALILSYIGILYIADRVIRKNKVLVA